MKKLFLSLLFFSSPVWAATLPQANLKVYPSVGAIDSPFTFDASDSRNAYGTKYGLKYRFRFKHNEKWTDFSWNPKAKFRPTKAGSFRAQLEVKDSQGRIQSTSQTFRVQVSDGRQARIKIRKNKVVTGEEILFELVLQAPLGEIKDKVLSRWDFDSDGHFETRFSRQKIVSHVFSRTGKFIPTVEIKWPSGKKETIKGISPTLQNNLRPRWEIPGKSWPKINVRQNPLSSPIIKSVPSGKEFKEGQMIRFDAGDSKIPRAGWIEWHFDGNRVVKSKKTVSHQFNEPGKHTLRVKSCYRRSNPICAETMLNFTIKPKATDFRARIQIQNLTHSNFSSYDKNLFFASTGDRVRFSALVKSGYYGSHRFQYRWDFEGDGDFDTSFSYKSSVEHTFDYSGTFQPKVEVWSDGITNLRQIVISEKKVFISQNTAPVGDFYSKPAQIFVGERVRFHPKVWDKQTQNSQLKIRWDIDGDGIWDTIFRNPVSSEWRFNTPGTFHARMQVQDRGGKTKTIEKNITVFAPAEPVAKVVVSNRYGTTNSSFQFDASRSEGRKLQYVWIFPGDGRGIQRHATGSARVTKRFYNPGKKILLCRFWTPMDNGMK